jgi:hypothetical protein
MFDHDTTELGLRQVYGGEAPALLSRADRRRHVYAIGKTGTGKTTLLERLIVQDITGGEGVALLDPHGDLAERLLDYIPRSRTDDLAYFNPADLAHPVGFNIVADVEPDLRHLAVSGAVSAFKAIWADSWGARLEYILGNALAALIETPGATLLSLPRLLTDDVYRVRVTARLEDPVVRRFWLEEFGAYDKRFRTEAIAPIQNKIGQFLMSPSVRNIFGQERQAIDFRMAMDRRQIVIANLAKGRIGSDKSNLIGSLLVSQFELAAMSRSDTPEEARPDFYLYVDEFQNFATTSFATILSEARKYRLSLHLFHQFLDQLAEPVRQAVFGNVGSMLAFRLGQSDAEVIAHEYDKEIEPRQLTELSPFMLYARTLKAGEPSQAYLMRTLPNQAERVGQANNMITQSRTRFGRARERVEWAIERRL